MWISIAVINNYGHVPDHQCNPVKNKYVAFFQTMNTENSSWTLQSSQSRATDTHRRNKDKKTPYCTTLRLTYISCVFVCFIILYIINAQKKDSYLDYRVHSNSHF